MEPDRAGAPRPAHVRSRGPAVGAGEGGQGAGDVPAAGRVDAHPRNPIAAARGTHDRGGPSNPRRPNGIRRGGAAPTAAVPEQTCRHGMADHWFRYWTRFTDRTHTSSDMPVAAEAGATTPRNRSPDRRPGSRPGAPPSTHGPHDRGLGILRRRRSGRSPDDAGRSSRTVYPGSGRL